MNPKVRPRLPLSTWAELERIGREVGITDPREVIGYLLKQHQAPEAEHVFQFGDFDAVYRAIWPNDSPIVIRGKARVGKTRTAKWLVGRVRNKSPVFVVDPMHEYEGKMVRLEDLFTMFENSSNGISVLRLNRESRDMSRLELINALRILMQKFGALTPWVIIFEEVSSRFGDIQELHAFFSEAAKFTRKTIGIEQTPTVLDQICRIIEIKEAV